MTAPKPPAEELAAAAEWRAAKDALGELQERIRKTGDVPPDDYAAAYNRVEAAAAAITIPDDLVTYNAAAWTGRTRGATEEHRLAQEAWYVARRLGWDDFLELRDRQKTRRAAAPKRGASRARARSATR